QPAMLEHAHLAPVFVLEVARGLLEGERGRLVDGSPTALREFVGEREIVPEARVDVEVVASPHGVEGAVSAGDRSKPGFLCAQPELVPPVGSFSVRSVRLSQAELPAYVGNVGVGEAGD